jgi:hypothetical protein
MAVFSATDSRPPPRYDPRGSLQVGRSLPCDLRWPASSGRVLAFLQRPLVLGVGFAPDACCGEKPHYPPPSPPWGTPACKRTRQPIFQDL